MSEDVQALIDAIAFLREQLHRIAWEPIPIWNRLWRAKWHLENALEAQLRREGI